MLLNRPLVNPQKWQWEKTWGPTTHEREREKERERWIERDRDGAERERKEGREREMYRMGKLPVSESPVLELLVSAMVTTCHALD